MSESIVIEDLSGNKFDLKDFDAINFFKDDKRNYYEVISNNIDIPVDKTTFNKALDWNTKLRGC